MTLLEFHQNVWYEKARVPYAIIHQCACLIMGSLQPFRYSTSVYRMYTHIREYYLGIAFSIDVPFLWCWCSLQVFWLTCKITYLLSVPQNKLTAVEFVGRVGAVKDTVTSCTRPYTFDTIGTSKVRRRAVCWQTNVSATSRPHYTLHRVSLPVRLSPPGQQIRNGNCRKFKFIRPANVSVKKFPAGQRSKSQRQQRVAR